MKSAILIGISRDEFDRLTPYELMIHVEAFSERKELELQNDLILVWLGEYYHRLKYLPDLKNEIAKITGKPTEMSDEEMLSMVKRLNAQMRGEVMKDGD